MKKMCNKKSILLLALVVAITLGGVGGTLAYLLDKDGPVENTFIPATVSSDVVEDFNEGDLEKKDVKIQNTSTIDAYIRAYVVVTWQDGEGNIHSQLPEEDEDYTISYGGTWIEDDGIYYWPKVVAANGVTGNLIDNCKVVGAAPAEGYTLHVEIVGSAIQADGKIDGKWAVEDAWGVTVTEGDTLADNTIEP